MWRFNVSGVGVINVEASNPQEALTRMIQYLRAQGITLESGTSIAPPTQINEFQVRKGETTVGKGRFGQFQPTTTPITTTPISDSETTDDGSVDPALPSLPGDPIYEPTGDGIADPALPRLPGDPLYKPTDPDVPVPMLGPDVDIRTVTGEDIWRAPFASFANAMNNHGLNTEGVLGSSISSQFNRMEPLRQLGTLTGTIPGGIGNEPGDLERFYSDHIGTAGNLAQSTLDALRAGGLGPKFGSEALNVYLEPDILNPDNVGRSAANEVINLYRAAATQKYGGLTASQILPSNAKVLEGYERGLARGLQPDFGAYVTRYFGV